MNQIVRPWRNLGGLVSLRISATAGPAEPLGQREALGQVVVADLGARDVGRLRAGGDLVDRAVAVLVGQVDHLLEVDHPHADLVLVLCHRLLGGVRARRTACRCCRCPGPAWSRPTMKWVQP